MHGPDIKFSYEEREGRVVRTAHGKLMTRRDVLEPDGWRDWVWIDQKTNDVWYLDSGSGPALAPTGVSEWKGHGPTIPASRNCLDCHKASLASFNVRPTALLNLNPGLVETTVAVGHWPKKSDGPAPQPPPAPVREGPRGPIGPPGPTGQDGRPGRDGKDSDPSLIIIAVKEWLSEHKDELRGPAGAPGIAGRDGAPGTVKVIVQWEDGTPIGTVPAAVSGSTARVILTKKEIARKLKE